MVGMDRVGVLEYGSNVVLRFHGRFCRQRPFYVAIYQEALVAIFQQILPIDKSIRIESNIIIHNLKEDFR